jgi:hypothetical protein
MKFWPALLLLVVSWVPMNAAMTLPLENVPYIAL